MVNGIDSSSSDFSVYVKILENKSFENIKITEPLSLLFFKILSFFPNKKITLSIFSIFIYLSALFFISKIAFQYLRKSQSTYVMLIISAGLSFPVLSLSQSILRNGMAIVIFLVMLASAKQLSLTLRLLIFCASVMTHNSMAVFLPLVFINYNFDSNKKTWFRFIILTIIYEAALNLLLIDSLKKVTDFSSINISISYFLISIFILLIISKNNFKNSFFPFLYMNTLIVILVNFSLINVDRFLYLPWLLTPILIFKFLKNNILIGCFSLFWVFINFAYQPSRFF